MKYKLMAIDVDGTLIGPDGKVTPATAEAVQAAARAGLRVCVATGRSYVETMPVWRQLELPAPHEPMVLISGALVSDPDSGRTLYQKAIPRQLACEYADALNEAGHSAAAIVDSWRHGVEYYLAESRDAQQVRKRWFAQMSVKVNYVRRLADAADMPDPLRINVVVDADEGKALAAKLIARFGQGLEIHEILAPNYNVRIVEAFAAGATKWTGVQYVAQAYRIGAGTVVAVGDDVNDLSMIRSAGLGVAMPHAPHEVASAAKVVAEGGLAEFIARLLAGRYDSRVGKTENPCHMSK